MAWITFQNERFLWLLLSIPLLVLTHFLTMRFVKRKALHFANFEAIERITGKKILQRNVFVLILRMIILAMFITSAAGPILWYKGKGSEYSFVLAIDASASMLADDIQPNRLEAAKAAAKDFLESVKGFAKVGLISFSGTSFVMQQPTADVDAVAKKVDEIDILPAGGTDLGEAIITSANLLIGDAKSKRIILLTDGKSTVGTDISIGIKQANENGIVVDTIGVGTEKGGKFANLNIISKLDSDSLKKIADLTGGYYFTADSKEGLSEAYQQISEIRSEILSQNLQVPLLIAGLVFLFVEWGLINTRFRTFP